MHLPDFVCTLSLTTSLMTNFIRRGNFVVQNTKAAEKPRMRILTKPSFVFSALTIFGVTLFFKFCPLCFGKTQMWVSKTQTSRNTKQQKHKAAKHKSAKHKSRNKTQIEKTQISLKNTNQFQKILSGDALCVSEKHKYVFENTNFKTQIRRNTNQESKRKYDKTQIRIQNTN